jgi:phosphatidylserine/phosphatidylglycerophosphate/cardiolipin synthase-like enzyme
MKLLVQPDDGVTPLAKAIDAAKKRVEITIFRLDVKEIERALKNAVGRGVYVRALIAHTNGAGDRPVRKLEMRLLESGVSVAQTPANLARYHDKMMIIDRQTLYLLAFNLTRLDVDRSRSFGIVTKHRKLVGEAVRLFEADSKRRRYTPGFNKLIVSPTNARKQLTSFIRGATKQLLIYDLKISDPAMVRLLKDRSQAGVEVRILGRLTRQAPGLPVRRLATHRLHARAIVRDRNTAFIGSQSLRTLELDDRREVGIIFRDSKAVRTLVETFEADWARSAPFAVAAQEGATADQPLPVASTAKRVAKVITGKLPPVSAIVEKVVKEVTGEEIKVELKTAEVNETVKEAVRDAVKDAVTNVMERAGEREEAKRS